jgi:hypothetical protein
LGLVAGELQFERQSPHRVSSQLGPRLLGISPRL